MVARLNLFSGKLQALQDGFAIASTLFADMLSDEGSKPLTSCSGVKRWGTSELMLQLTTPTAAAQVPCNASHEQNTSRHAHSQCTGCERTGSLALTTASVLRTTSISPAHANSTSRSEWEILNNTDTMHLLRITPV